MKIFLVDDAALIRHRVSAVSDTLADIVVVGESADCDTAMYGVQACAADFPMVDFHLPGSSGVTIVELLTGGSLPVITLVLTNH